MSKQQQLTAAAFYLLLTMLMGSCNTAPHNIPFPQQESEFTAAATEKLSFSEPKKFEWVTINRDSFQPARTEKFDIEKIPSKPVDLGNPVPLVKPMTDTVFDLKRFKDTAFNFEKIPTQQLKFKLAVLGQPKRTKSGIPRLKDGASESLLQLGLDQGLSGTIFSDFKQDKNGIMWIATDDGLNRFDGEYCENYSLAQGLSYTWINYMLIDNSGQLWIQYQGGLGVSVINTKTGIIKHLTQAEGLLSNFIRGIKADDKGRIWICTSGGVSVIDEKAGTIKNITKKNGLGGNNIGPVFLDSKGRIWIGRRGRGVDVINEKKDAIKHIDETLGIGKNGITFITGDKQGRLWFGTTAGGVMMLDENAGLIKRFNSELEPGNLNIGSIAFDEMNRIWIATIGGGVYVFDEKASTIKHLNATRGLNNDNVFSIYADNHHQIWMGMHGGEANIYNTSAGNIRHLTSNSSGLSNKTSFYYGLSQDNRSRIWVGSLRGGGGIDIIDEKNGTIKNISTSNGLPFNNVTYLFTDSRNRTWIITNNILEVIDEKEGTIKYLDSAQGISSWGTNSNIFEDSRGQIWLGRKGIFVMNEEQGTIKNITREQDLAGNLAKFLAEDNQGQIWVGRDDGLEIINTKDGTIRQLLIKGLKSFEVSGLLKDSKGNMWFGTSGNGLFMVNTNAGTITKFAVANGLANMVIYSINERNGSIYVGTGRGLTVITPGNDLASQPGEKNSWYLKSYGKSQGFLRVDHNPRSLLDKEGKLWFGIADVLTIMEEPKNDSLVPPAFITGLDVMGQPQNFATNKSIQSYLLPTDTIWDAKNDTFYLKTNLPPDTGYLQKNNISWDSTAGPYNLPVNLQLPYSKNHITFHFTGMHLDNMNKTRYRYVLEGSDKTWSDFTGRATAEYRNLGYGKYVFKVSSCGFNGLWSKPAEIAFTILPPWWKSWWAYTFYAFCFLGLLFFADKIQRRRLITLEQEKTREKEFQQAKEIEKAYNELKTTQAQLIQSEKMASLGELTAGIAHEIQNPLNFVNNFSEVNTELIDEMRQELDKGNIDEAKAIASDIKDNEQKINHHGKRADSIVKGMLQHSRNSSGQKELTDINALADECLRLSFHGLRAKDKSFNAKTETDFDNSIPKINIASQDIGRVILNLFTNAFYSVMQKRKQLGDAYEPVVSVVTSKTANGVSIAISDNGNGVPQKVMDKIFQPFFTTKPVGEGTGLGLSMSYEIITKGHNGELKVETKEGEFAKFIINLPV